MKRKHVIYILLAGLLLSSIIISSQGLNQQFLPSTERTVPSQVGPTETAFDKLMQNTTYTTLVRDFLNRSQEIGGNEIDVMDDAYYIGKGLWLSGQLLNSQVNSQTELLDFVHASHNIDGGYGNWEGSKSSMESTYQAIELFHYLDTLKLMTEQDATKIFEFVVSLQAPSGGFYPLPNWDEADVTSTFRALRIIELLENTFPTINYQITGEIESFLRSTYIPPIFLNGASGYAETVDGQPEIIATSYVLRSFDLLNVTTDHFDNVANFLKLRSFPNGGISNTPDSLAQTGYTASGVELYLSLILDKYSSYSIETIIDPAFLNNTLNYLKSTKNPDGGFTSSERDITAEISSTYFVLNTLYSVDLGNLNRITLDLTGVEEFLTNGKQPKFGVGNYPGDNSNMYYTYLGLNLRKLLGNDWINPGISNFITESYDPDRGGFGFWPGAETRVKYTYYGIRAIRSINSTTEFYDPTINFVLRSRNGDGGFGEQPGSTLSYLTHTYWAVQSLIQLGYNVRELGNSKMLSFLEYYQNNDGTFSNYPGLNSSLVSTYRGISLTQLFDRSIAPTSTIYSTFDTFSTISGGFRPDFETQTATMEATYYAVQLARTLDISLNSSKIETYVLSLMNDDGGFGIREGYTSRVSSTYQALFILSLLDADNIQINNNIYDTYAPIILPAFNPILDTNKTISGSYILNSELIEPESNISFTWIESKWQNGTHLFSNQYTGVYNEEGQYWSYIMGPYDWDGYLEFRIHAQDENNNTALSSWFSLQTVGRMEIDQVSDSFDLLDLVPFIPLFVVGMSIVDSIGEFRKKQKLSQSDVKMQILEKNQQVTELSAFYIFYLILIMATISYLGRLFIADAGLILEQSTFLFRYLIAALFILFTRYVIRIRAFGFFSSSVLAISWLGLGPVWGFFVFFNIFILSYVVRKLISPLDLAVGFRIGMMMVVTVTSLALLEMAGEVFRIPSLSSTILLPIIITPWLVDRFVREEEEYGSTDAVIRLFLTVVIIFGSYLLMSFDQLVLFITLNPETWVIILALMLYLGRSQYYSWFDKRRFSRLFDNGDQPLSIITRNRDYIGKYNPKMLYPYINKFQLKEQFDKWRVPTAEVLAVLNHEDQIDELIHRFHDDDKFSNGFIIKPSESFGGRGIIVVKECSDGIYQVGDIKYNDQAIKGHIKKIIQGEYLTSQTNSERDTVLIEEKINPDQDFGSLGVGLADIRVIVFKGIPIMTMARIPTHASDGLANLKQGAIGASILLKNGIINRAEYKQYPVSIHPDTERQLEGYKFENWVNILAVASLAQKSTGLGYAGVDLVLDDMNRILVLEVNKRPGLEIQNINLKGLIDRIEYIEAEDLDARENSPLHAAKLSMKIAAEHWEVDR